jgi:hypothetical protein
LATIVKVLDDECLYEVEDDDVGADTDATLQIKRMQLPPSSVIPLPDENEKFLSKGIVYIIIFYFIFHQFCLLLCFMFFMFVFFFYLLFLGTPCLGVFPATTAFYSAVVTSQPKKKNDNCYLLTFNDDEDETGSVYSFLFKLNEVITFISAF